MSFAEMVTQSIFTRALAAIFLFAVLLVALVIGGYDLTIGREIPAIVNTIIGGGVSYSCIILGLTFGVVLQPAPAPAKEVKNVSPTELQNSKSA